MEKRFYKKFPDLMSANGKGNTQIKVLKFIEKEKEASFEEGKRREREKERLNMVTIITKHLLIHKELEEQWTGIKADGSKDKENPHAFVVEILTNLVNSLPAPNEDLIKSLEI